MTEHSAALAVEQTEDRVQGGEAADPATVAFRGDISMESLRIGADYQFEHFTIPAENIVDGDGVGIEVVSVPSTDMGEVDTCDETDLFTQFVLGFPESLQEVSKPFAVGRTAAGSDVLGG